MTFKDANYSPLKPLTSVSSLIAGKVVSYSNR